MSLSEWLDAHGIAMPEPTPVTVWPAPGRLATAGQRSAVRWVDFFARPLETAAPKDALPAWSPATFRDDRRGIAHHERSLALVLDLDAHTPAAVLFARLREPVGARRVAGRVGFEHVHDELVTRGAEPVGARRAVARAAPRGERRTSR